MDTAAWDTALAEFVRVQAGRFRPWTLEAPLLIDAARIDWFTAAQGAMADFIEALVRNYPALAPRLPQPPEVRDFLLSLDDMPFTPGTFRTDFVTDAAGRLALIEITCRYPLNGFFTSMALNSVVADHPLATTRAFTFSDPMAGLPARFRRWMGDNRRFVIVQGDDNRGNESRHLKPLVEIAGLEFHHIPVRDWPASADTLLPGAAILAELDFDEWLSLPRDLVRRMMRRPLLNDPRLVFLAHDKAFFALAHDRDLVAGLLAPEQAAILRQAFALTVLPGTQPALWDDARCDPAGWVLKPRHLGRSVDIRAGGLLDPAVWQQSLDEAAERNMILQRWLPPRVFHGHLAGQPVADHIAGTLLFWGREFFGPGLFRTSSHPITNVTDDRKLAYRIVTSHDRHALPGLQWL